MTNFEFHKEQFDTTDLGMVKGKPIRCYDIGCEACDWCNMDCDVVRWAWLKAEYEAPKTDWSKIEVDTPILVSSDAIRWNRRYFARAEENDIYAWANGLTSWTSYNAEDVTWWKYAKLAEVADD